MNMHVTIWRATSPCAKCRNCGSDQQYHGMPGRQCVDFVAITAEDVEPAGLRIADLMRHCVSCDQERTALVDKGDFTAAESARLDWLNARVDACRADLSERIHEMFGTDIADVAGVLGMEVLA